MHKGGYGSKEVNVGILFKLIIIEIFSIQYVFDIKPVDINKEIKLVSQSFFEREKYLFEDNMIIENKIISIDDKKLFRKKGKYNLFIIGKNTKTYNMSEMFRSCKLLEKINL